MALLSSDCSGWQATKHMAQASAGICTISSIGSMTNLLGHSPYFVVIQLIVSYVSVTADGLHQCLGAITDDFHVSGIGWLVQPDDALAVDAADCWGFGEHGCAPWVALRRPSGSELNNGANGADAAAVANG